MKTMELILASDDGKRLFSALEELDDEGKSVPWQLYVKEITPKRTIFAIWVGRCVESAHEVHLHDDGSWDVVTHLPV